MQTPIKYIVRLFNLNAKSVVRREDQRRWISAIRELSEYNDLEIKHEFNGLLKREGMNKPPLYYLEGVRRRLKENAHAKIKQAPVSQSIKEIMRSV